MKVERYQCDRPGCHAFSNGDVSAWWAVFYTPSTIEVRTLTGTMSLCSPGGWKHFCGIQHAIETVQDAMRAMAAGK